MSDQIPRSARDDKRSFRLSRVLLFQILLVVSSGSLGATRLLREGNARPIAFLMMLALPVASAVIAGSFSTPSLEKPRPDWPVSFTLPIMHVAWLFALAALFRSSHTGLEVPQQIHKEEVWTEWPLIVSSFATEVVVVVVALLALRLMKSNERA